jgi:hypothetical protein
MNIEALVVTKRSICGRVDGEIRHKKSKKSEQWKRRNERESRVWRTYILEKINYLNFVSFDQYGSSEGDKGIDLL